MRDLPSLKVSKPVSVVALIPSAEMPKARPVHIKLSEFKGGVEVIVPLWAITDDNGHFGTVGSVHIPQKLLFEAVWIYDIEKRNIIKNKTGAKFIAPLGVTEVDRSWLAENGYVRMRRPSVAQPTPTVV